MRQFCPRGAAPLAVSLLLACSDSGQVVVLSDTTASGPPLVVVALPTDPSTIHPATPEIPPGPRGDSVRLGRALTDSAAQLDLQFQRLRTQLNDQAREMLAMNRHEEKYARAFDRWTQRAANARSLRAARDKFRKRATKIFARFPRFFQKAGESLLPRTAAAGAAATRGGKLVQQPLGKHGATLELSDGEWWITTDSAGFLKLPAQPVSVEAGSVDTIRLAEPRDQNPER